ncbi:MAG: hypothetical protein U9Q03_01265 [Patescibacteria group bacterium]|nr:hypothetical protein [Patescibacteria group bacterium]
MSKKKVTFFNEFTILGTFVVVALAGLAIGAVSLIADYQKYGPVEPLVTAPPVGEYRAEARAVVAPFLGQAAVISQVVVPEGADRVMGDLVDMTQERLLGMTVPATERDAHLSMVILLDQWRRALSGTELDMAGVATRTDGLLADYPWLASF